MPLWVSVLLVLVLVLAGGWYVLAAIRPDPVARALRKRAEHARKALRRARGGPRRRPEE